jgi:succinyl-diaminopimelate desuccinylase
MNNIRLLQKLVRIDSRNPPGNERQIIYFIRDYLRNLNIDSRIYEFSKNRLNLVCVIKSKYSRKKILFTPHVDTVPVTGKWKFPALAGVVKGGRLYGRGASDCKVNVAVALGLIKKIVEEKILLKNLDLIFAFCGDEETGNKFGTIPLLKKLKTKINYGVVLDADDFNIIVAQKGLLHLRIELFGKEAHGAYPDRGINAVSAGVRILNKLLDKKFLVKPHKLLRQPTLSIGKFCGGDKVNIVAGWAFFEIDLRYLPAMNKEDIIKDIEQIVKEQKIKYKIKVLSHQKPIEINTNSPAIKIMQKVLAAKKIKSEVKPSFGATVITYLQEKGIDTFAFGFGSSRTAHTKNEYVEIKNIPLGVDVLVEYVKRLNQAMASSLQ